MSTQSTAQDELFESPPMFAGGPRRISRAGIAVPRFDVVLALAALLSVSLPYAVAAPVAVRGGAFPELETSARAMALGGNLSALADGSDALSGNPAGLLALADREVSVGYADLFGLGLVRHTSAQLAWPRLRRETLWESGEIRTRRRPPPAGSALALGASHLGTDVEVATNDANYGETQFALAGAWLVRPGLRAGLGLRFLWAQSSLPQFAAQGQTLDFGLLQRTGAIEWGLSVRNLASGVNWERGDDDGLEQRWHAGAAWRAGPGSFGVSGSWRGPEFTFDLTSAQAEVRPMRALALRAALRRREESVGTATEWSAGAGVAARGFRFDYARRSAAHGLGDTDRFSVGLPL